MDNYEIGPYSMDLTVAAQKNLLFKGIESGSEFLFSHFDYVLKLPTDAIRLASTQLDANSAFKLRNIWGIQCHPELTGSLLSTLMLKYLLL